jgi:hypothetical protein
MQGSFGNLELLVLVTVAIALENPVPTALVVVAPQELGHFEFDGFLEHELGTQADGFGERSLSRGRAEELFFEGLAGELAFHDCLSLSVLAEQLEFAPSRFLQEA